MSVWRRRIDAALLLGLVVFVASLCGFQASYTLGEVATLVAAYEIIQIGIWVDEEERLDNEESA